MTALIEYNAELVGLAIIDRERDTPTQSARDVMRALQESMQATGVSIYCSEDIVIWTNDKPQKDWVIEIDNNKKIVAVKVGHVVVDDEESDVSIYESHDGRLWILEYMECFIQEYMELKKASVPATQDDC
jgi:hypothetical protein